MVAIGEVSAFDFDPVRAIVRRVVRALAGTNDLEILLDWKGVLLSPPCSLTAGRSNVLVVDGSGRIAVRRTDAVPPREMEALVAEVVRLCLAPRPAES